MTRRIAVVGGGAVGVRVVRDLIVHEGADVVLASRDPERHRGVASSFAGRLQVVHADRLDTMAEVDTVVLATPPGDHGARGEAELRRGRSVVSCSDDPDDVEVLLGLDRAARAAGRSVVPAAVFGPGLTCLLVAWGVGGFDEVEEVRIARLGAGGPSCARRRRRAARAAAMEWRDGWQRSPAFSGRELVWFPEPIGARDCFHAGVPDPALLLGAIPGVHRISARLAASRRNRVLDGLPMLLPPPAEGGLGAVRVELRGTIAGRCEDLVLGAVERPATAAAAVAAMVAARAGTDGLRVGAGGLAAAAVDPGAWLAELHRRGVRAARFDGARHA